MPHANTRRPADSLREPVPLGDGAKSVDRQLEEFGALLGAGEFGVSHDAGRRQHLTRRWTLRPTRLTNSGFEGPTCLAWGPWLESSGRRCDLTYRYEKGESIFTPSLPAAPATTNLTPQELAKQSRRDRRRHLLSDVGLDICAGQVNLGPVELRQLIDSRLTGERPGIVHALGAS